MSQTKELLKHLEDTTKFLQEITVVEEAKFQAAMKQQILVLEDCIKKEQALVLRSKGLDLKRTALQKAMGAEDQTLKQIITNTNEADKPLLQTAFDALQAQLVIYQEVHHRAKTAIEVNLHRVNAQLEALTGETPAYSERGVKQQSTAPKFTSRRI